MLDYALAAKLLFDSAKNNFFHGGMLGSSTRLELTVKVIRYIYCGPHIFSLPYLWQSRQMARRGDGGDAKDRRDK